MGRRANPLATRLSMIKLPARNAVLLAATLVLAPFLLFGAKATATAMHRHAYVFFDGEETGCLPWEWYWGTRQVGAISRGDLVTFRNEQSSLFARGALMTKLIAGVPGDTVVIEQGVSSINGRVLGTLARGAQHFLRPINAWNTRYRIAPGHYFVLGSEYRSYDSRYRGTIRYDQILTKDMLLD